MCIVIVGFDLPGEPENKYFEGLVLLVRALQLIAVAKVYTLIRQLSNKTTREIEIERESYLKILRNKVNETKEKSIKYHVQINDI